MAKPKPSLALEHPFFLEAEYTRRQFKNEYRSPDVFWIRLALKEREIHEADEPSDGNEEKFQRELGEAIFLGGLGSARRFENARESIRGESAVEPPDDMEYFDAYFGCCEELQRLPTLPEMRRRFHDATQKPRLVSEYQRQQGLNPSEAMIKEMLDTNWEKMEGDGVVDAGDFRGKCRSLGLLLSDGNHRAMMERICKELGFAPKESVDLRSLIRNVYEVPKLRKYLLPNWNIEQFFWWWEGWASEESATILDREHAGLTALVDTWSGYVRQWMSRLTKDGAVPIRPASSLGRIFWKLAGGERRPPSLPEMLVKISDEDIGSAICDCWCADDALGFLISFRDELRERCAEAGTMSKVRVADVESLARVLCPYQEIHAFQYSMARMGFEVL